MSMASRGSKDENDNRTASMVSNALTNQSHNSELDELTPE